MADQKYMWARLDLPCPIDEIGNIDRWKVIGGDPVSEAVALLKDVVPFIGYQASVDDLVERTHAFIETYEVHAFAEERRDA